MARREVKTPTLALVVNREKEIRDFRPSDYHELSGRYSKDGIPFTATLKVPGDAPADGKVGIYHAIIPTGSSPRGSANGKVRYTA